MFILAKRVLCDWWKVVLLFGLTGVVNQLLAAQPAVVVSATPNVAGSSTFSLSSNGALYGWGADTYGQLGVGRISNSSTFLLTGSGFRSVSVGESHVAAIKTDNSLWTWGQNSYRQLGDGSSTAHSTPVKIGSDYQSVVAGSASTLGLKLDGTLWIWGQGFFGDGNWIGSSGVPVLVGSGYAAMATGGGHVLALKMDGTLWGWGPSQYGQLGLVANDICNPGTNSTYTCSFTKRLIGSGYIALAAGAASSYALGIDGILWVWGQNDSGQLGDGTTVQRSSPTKVGSNFASIAAGNQHAVASRPTVVFGLGVAAFMTRYPGNQPTVHSDWARATPALMLAVTPALPSRVMEVYGPRNGLERMSGLHEWLRGLDTMSLSGRTDLSSVGVATASGNSVSEQLCSVAPRLRLSARDIAMLLREVCTPLPLRPTAVYGRGATT